MTQSLDYEKFEQTVSNLQSLNKAVNENGSTAMIVDSFRRCAEEFQGMAIQFLGYRPPKISLDDTVSRKSGFAIAIGALGALLQESKDEVARRENNALIRANVEAIYHFFDSMGTKPACT
ncbi:MAG: hypothetical protein SFW62_09075 [Alphaproteobacteria bacterium]|nr:hypothetical protein [Alphaproteobacteria bacterium]